MLEQIKRLGFSFTRRRETDLFLKRTVASFFASDDEKLAAQLYRFNVVWKEAIDNVPFYRSWKDKYALPEKIFNISEIADWPTISKAELQREASLLFRESTSRILTSVTGGSTGEPMRFSLFPDEVQYVTSNKWIGWRGYGIDPLTRRYVIWGHRHFYGKGMSRYIKILARNIKDGLVNTRRTNAIDLNPLALRSELQDIIRYKPKTIVAYSTTMLAMCRSCLDLAVTCRTLGVEAVICSAGPLKPTERNEVSKFWNCPVGMEYGSMEAGVIAYTHPSDGRYRTFLDTHLLHTVQDRDQLDRCIVTRLTRNYLPLIRYEIGDYLLNPLSVSGSVISFDDVAGRDSDWIRLSSGTEVHLQAFMVAAESNPDILAFQVVILQDGIQIRVVARKTLSKQECATVKAKLVELNPNLMQEKIDIVNVRDIERTPAGKIRLVKYEKD